MRRAVPALILLALTVTHPAAAQDSAPPPPHSEQEQLEAELIRTRAENGEIRSQDLAGLRVHINELYDLSFDRAALASGFVSVDISQYLVAGTNVIRYNPVGRDGTATVSVVVR